MRDLRLRGTLDTAAQTTSDIAAVQAATSIASTPTNGVTFKRFDISGGDVLPSVREIESATCWADDANGILTGAEMFVSTTGVAETTKSSSLYYANVYSSQDNAASGSNPLFAVAYGHRLGSGSVQGVGAGYSGNVVGATPTKAVYSQYRNLLLQPGDETFTFGGTGSNDIFVVNLNRASYKEKLDPGNWELTLGSGTKRTFIDDSGAGQDPTIGQSGRVFRIRSGSILGGTSSTDSVVYGLAYPDIGVLVFHPKALTDASLVTGTPLDFTTVTSLAWGSNNNNKFFTSINGGGNFQARTEEAVTSTYYFVRVRNNEFNYTNNPTFVTGSAGLIRYSLFQNDPRVYITGVGLYDNNNQLLAVAKLSKPLLKSFTRECLIRVKLTY